MQIKTLYRYNREGGGVTVSPNMPSVPYTVLYRLIADDGKVLTNGTTTAPCVDTAVASGWAEIDEPKEDKAEG